MEIFSVDDGLDCDQLEEDLKDRVSGRLLCSSLDKSDATLETERLLLLFGLSAFAGIFAVL